MPVLANLNSPVSKTLVRYSRQMGPVASIGQWTQVASVLGLLQMEHPQENAKARGKSQKPRAMTAYQEARTLAGAILPEGIFLCLGLFWVKEPSEFLKREYSFAVMHLWALPSQVDFLRNRHNQPLAVLIIHVGPHFRRLLPMPSFLFLDYCQLTKAYPGSQP